MLYSENSTTTARLLETHTRNTLNCVKDTSLPAVAAGSACECCHTFHQKKKKKRCQMTKMVISRVCYLRLLPVVKPVLLLQLLYGGKGLRQAPVQPQHHLAAVSRR